jgi:thioesterase domain-containing protein
VLCYATLARLLGQDQPFYGLQAEGLYGEQAPAHDVVSMAARYIEALRRVQPEGPYQLGGWCIGAVIAVEMAQQLQEQEQTVALLALIDGGAPIGTANERPAIDNDLLVEWFIDEYHLSISADDLQRLSPNERVMVVLDHAKKRNLVPPDMTLAQVGQLIDIYNSNVMATRRYTPQACAQHITLFRASAELTAGESPTMGWEKFAASGITVHTIPGNHYTILEEPNVQVLAEQLRACLEHASV